MKALIKVEINDFVYYCNRVRVYKDHIQLIVTGIGTIYSHCIYFSPKKVTPILSIYYAVDKHNHHINIKRRTTNA